MKRKIEFYTSLFIIYFISQYIFIRTWYTDANKPTPYFRSFDCPVCWHI